jgi:tripartite-type tricarboxylate transporter receptor subunit TctC
MKLRHLARFFLLLGAAAMPASAQSWPAKTARIIVPFGSSSTPDTLARLLADGLGKKSPNSVFVVENRPGASGNIGTNAVAKALVHVPYSSSPQAITAVIRNAGRR